MQHRCSRGNGVASKRARTGGGGEEDEEHAPRTLRHRQTYALSLLHCMFWHHKTENTSPEVCRLSRTGSLVEGLSRLCHAQLKYSAPTLVACSGTSSTPNSPASMQMLSPNPSDVIASDGARCCELSTAGSRAVVGVERSPSHSGLACSWDVCRGRGHGRVLGANCSEYNAENKDLCSASRPRGLGRCGEVWGDCCSASGCTRPQRERRGEDGEVDLLHRWDPIN